MRIGEIADAVGTTSRTIRYYEEIGLLRRADERASGQHRTYTEQDVERLRDALRLKDLLGLSLDELREVVRRTRGRAQVEVSGGVTLERLDAIAETGAEFVSVGALTHSASAVDISLEIEPLPLVS